MKRSITRVRGEEFCTLEISLENGRLSICGIAGDVMRTASAKRQALAYWVSFFEDSPEEIKSMNERCSTAFRSARSAARYVLASDGEFHGLDVTREESGRVYIGHSFGQIRTELARFFPECVPYFAWHLNDMHAECVHQEALGITYQNDPDHECFEPGCMREIERTNAWGEVVIETVGYKIGSQWLRRDLPANVIAWAETFGASES